MKKLFVFACMFCLMLSATSVSVGAVDSRASLYLNSYGAYATAVGSEEIVFEFDVTTPHTMDYVGASQISVQVKNNSDIWATVATYSSDDYSDFLKYNTNSHVGSVTYEGVAGNTYRAKITVCAGNSTGSDSRTIYTKSVTAY